MSDKNESRETGRALMLDGEALRAAMARVNIHKLHYFPDGRKVWIESAVKPGGKHVYEINTHNPVTGLSWSEMIGYHDLRECVSIAETIFGITAWNAV